MTLSNAFSPVNNSAGHYRKTSKIQGSKTSPPFSLRLNAEERARLTKEARGVPLGTYIKAKLLGDGTPIRLRGSGVSVEDKAALARIPRRDEGTRCPPAQRAERSLAPDHGALSGSARPE